MNRLYVCLLGLLLLAACTHQTEKSERDEPVKPGASELKLKDDGTAYVTGKVTATHGDCAIGACTLTIETDAREVRVIYADSIRPCPAGKLGAEIVIGDAVKAFGNYARDGEDGLIDVCTGRGGFLERQ